MPQVLQIGGFFHRHRERDQRAGGGVPAVFWGPPLMCAAPPKAIKIGAVVIGTKVALSVLLGLGVAFLCNDNFLGLSSLAVISAVSVANNALSRALWPSTTTMRWKGAVAILAERGAHRDHDRP